MKHIKVHEDYGYNLLDVKECVEYSKNIMINDLMEEGTSIKEIWHVVHKLRHQNIKLATALATVLIVGYFTGEDGQFMLPTNKKCMARFKEVGKLLAKNRPLLITEWDCEYEVDEEGQICSYTETTKTYKLTHHGMSIKEEVKEF